MGADVCETMHAVVHVAREKDGIVEHPLQKRGWIDLSGRFHHIRVGEKLPRSAENVLPKPRENLRVGIELGWRSMRLGDVRVYGERVHVRILHGLRKTRSVCGGLMTLTRLDPLTHSASSCGIISSIFSRASTVLNTPFLSIRNIVGMP